jgi:hypothetical protein
MDQAALEVDAGYEVFDRFVVFGGLRYRPEAKVKTTGALDVVREADGRELDRSGHRCALHHSINDAWSASFRGDIGGSVWVRFRPGRNDSALASHAGFGVLAAYRYMAGLTTAVATTTHTTWPFRAALGMSGRSTF